MWGRGRIAVVLCLMLALLVPIVLFATGRLTLNVTASVPVGLYWLDRFDSRTALGNGRLVLTCVPPAAGRVALARHYVESGSCQAGETPFLKYVVAGPGDQVVVSAAGVAVNGERLRISAPLTRDSVGRSLYAEARMYRLAAGNFWLYAPEVRSYDSRYFGPVAQVDILAVARPLFTEHQR